MMCPDEDCNLVIFMRGFGKLNVCFMCVCVCVFVGVCVCVCACIYIYIYIYIYMNVCIYFLI